MGNGQAIIAKETPANLRVLNLSRRLTAEEYVLHTKGKCIEGSLVTIPLDIIYYDEISLFEEVNLGFNFISYIPEEFSLRVPHLRNLNLSHNQLNELPNSFHLLLHLRTLDLSFNKIETFPDPVIQLPKLETFNLSHNALSDLPASISKLKRLKRLNLGHNNLRALPDSLLECSDLEVIVCLGNNLIHPPQAVCDTGSTATLEYLSQKRIYVVRRTSCVLPPCSNSVFTRFRGRQVMVSVANPESASREYKQAQGSVRTNKKKCPLMVPELATSLSPDQLKDTILGLVYGACIGDAFALNMESLTKDECLFFYNKNSVSLEDRITDHLRSHFPPNDWSSNSDLMLLTLDSLMRWGGVVDELEIASQVVQWRVHGIPEIDSYPGYLMSKLQQQVVSSEGYAVHPHSVAQSCFRRLKDDQDKGMNMNINLSDNSCLPCAVVLGIPNFYKEQEVAMNAERICKATHYSPLTITSGVFTALCTSYLLQGKFHEKDGDIESLIKEIKLQSLSRLNQDEFLEKHFDTSNQMDIPSSDVRWTSKYITEILSSKSNFTDALSQFFFLGGEGLSAHCCVIGGVLGAFYGYSNIPQEWLKQLPLENRNWLSSKMNHLLDLFGLP